MTIDEAIEKIEVLKALIEWDYPMDFQLALDMALVLLKEASDGR